MKQSSFTAETVSDQKRVARATHWHLARALLRAADVRHHARWNLLTLAGGSPAGEVNCIRELMPNAHITAADVDPACVEAAKAAGADEGLLCNLSDWSGYVGRLPEPLQRRRFDVVNLDLCATASRDTRDLVRAYLRACQKVLMVTFSYGRDVVEHFKFNVAPRRSLLLAGVPELLASRISYLLPDEEASPRHVVESVIQYRGAEMPMCSFVVRRVRGRLETAGRPISFHALQEGDLEVAVEHVDLSRLYDLSPARLSAMRATIAARKAVATRRARQQEAA